MQPQPFETDHPLARLEPQLLSRGGVGCFLRHRKNLVGRGVAIVPGHVRDAFEDGDRPIDLHGGHRRDEPPPAVLDIDDAVLLKQFQRFAQRRTRDLEALRQLRLGRQFVAGIEPFVANQICDAVAELNDQCARITKGFVQFLSLR
ncbi:hypothetical protein D9M72_573820 [compost metagenome]